MSASIHFLRTFLCLPALFLLGLSVWAHEYEQIGLPVTKVFGVEDLQNRNQAWSLAQTPNGFIYAGTGDGIVGFDGENWHNHLPLNEGIVWDLKHWKDGRLYAGTANDFGYYAADEQGRLAYYSVLEDFTFEQRQFGDVWSSAANDSGILFITSKAMYFYDGQQLHQVEGAPVGRFRVFALEDRFLFKPAEHESLMQLTVSQPQFTLVDTALALPPGHQLRQVSVNRQGNVWVLTRNNGVYEQQGESLIQTLPGGQNGLTEIYHGIQASDGYYYLGAIQHGLFILNESFELVRRYGENDNLEMSTIFTIMEDAQGNIWLGGEPNVVRMIPPHRFSKFKMGGKSTSAVKMAHVDGVMTVSGHGLFQYRQQDPLTAPVFEQITDNANYRVDLIEFERHLLHTAGGGVHAMSLDSPEEGFSLIAKMRFGYHFAIYPDSPFLYVSSHAGLFRLSYVDQDWVSELVPGTEDALELLEIGPDGVIWAGTRTQELYKIEVQDASHTQWQVSKFSEQHGLPKGNAFPFQIRQGVIIGTASGANIVDEAAQTVLQSAPFLPDYLHTTDDTLYRFFDEPFLDDAQQRIWFDTDQGAGYIQKQSDGSWEVNDSIFGTIGEASFRGFHAFEPGILWVTFSDGQIFRINVERTKVPPPIGKLNIGQVTDLVNQTTVNGGLALEHFPTLDQSANALRIRFALAADSGTVDPLYRHRLVGADNSNWTEWRSETYQDFTQLSGGDYRFEVQAIDAWDRVSETALSFTVLPPWYLSQAAILAYVALALLVLALTAWLSQKWRTRILKQRNLQLQQTVEERTQQVRAKVEELREQQILKDRFFANVSHEFRTPLTLTIGPLEAAVKEHEQTLDGPVKQLINTALGNANKMLALVGQVLDMNRLEAGKLPLHVSQYDLAELMRQLQQRFEPWAAQHSQSVQCEDCDDPLMAWFDQDQIDKCLANLLSNAIKYSGNGSQIVLRLIKQVDRIGLVVQDNGEGISASAQSKVFERFYQDKSSEHAQEPGTGIGLAMVKEIVELHSGQVDLASSLGEGSTFTLWLKTGKAHFHSEQIQEPIHLEDTSGVGTLAATPVAALDENDKTTLLVVDDNSELLNFISLRLSASYKVIQARNGLEGFSAACESLPDLIISDVMMPEMTGLELTEKLKNTPATATIPVILLTAKATKRETVEGFASGADDYLTKPFDTSELVMRVNAQINARKVIRNSIDFENSSSITGLNRKDSFVDSLNQQVMAHLSEPDFNVEKLASLMHMSRDTLTRKCKREIDLSPLAYIRQVRMHHATILLQQNQISISEIAYALGFESLAYFSRSFKKHVGKSPSEFATQAG